MALDVASCFVFLRPMDTTEGRPTREGDSLPLTRLFHMKVLPGLSFNVQEHLSWQTEWIWPHCKFVFHINSQKGN